MMDKILNILAFAWTLFVIGVSLLLFMRAFFGKNKKRMPELYSVSVDVPLPDIDGYFVFNGDQIYYPETRKRYLATGDQWIDIGENFRGVTDAV